MLLPAATGSGPSLFEMFRVGDDETVLVSSGPAVGALLIFFFNYTASTDIYPLSLHDALPISRFTVLEAPAARPPMFQVTMPAASVPPPVALTNAVRSEERRVGKERRSRWSPYH